MGSQLTLRGMCAVRENNNTQLDLGGEGEDSESPHGVERAAGNDVDEKDVGGAWGAAWEEDEQSGGMENVGIGDEETEGWGGDEELEVSLWTVQDVMAALWSDLSRKAVSDYKLVGCPPPHSPRAFGSLALEQDPDIRDMLAENGEPGLEQEGRVARDLADEALLYPGPEVGVEGEMGQVGADALGIGENSEEFEQEGSWENGDQAAVREQVWEGEGEDEQEFEAEEDAARHASPDQHGIRGKRHGSILASARDDTTLTMIREFVSVTHPLETVTHPPLQVQISPEQRLMNVSYPRLIVRQKSESPPALNPSEDEEAREGSGETLQADVQAHPERELRASGASEPHTPRGGGLKRWLSRLTHPFSPLKTKEQADCKSERNHRGGNQKGDDRLRPPPPPPSSGQELRAGGARRATEEGREGRWHRSREGQETKDVAWEEESEENMAVAHGWVSDGDATLSPLPQIIQRVDAFMRKCSRTSGASGAPFDARILDVSHLADNQPNHLAYALRRLSRANPSIQHLNLKGFTALAHKQVFVVFLGLIRALSSLWALNLEGIYFSAPQQKQLLLALSHSRISHMALPVCTHNHQQALLGVLGVNAQRHSMWRLGGDPTQNNIILHVQGLWEDPADDPANKDWLRENLSFSQLEARQRR